MPRRNKPKKIMDKPAPIPEETEPSTGENVSPLPNPQEVQSPAEIEDPASSATSQNISSSGVAQDINLFIDPAELEFIIISSLPEPHPLSPEISPHLKSEHMKIVDDFFGQYIKSPCPQFLECFVQQNTHKDRLDLIYQLIWKEYSMFLPRKKCDVIAKKLQERGTEFFNKNETVNALYNYNKSVAFANSELNLSLGYANRSLCHMKMCLYDDCYVDAYRALKTKYPGNVQKIINRRDRAFQLKIESPKPSYYHLLPHLSSGEGNPNIQSASSAIELRTNQEFGRHYVATIDINVGDCIMVERALVSNLNREVDCHCYHCLELCHRLIPCDTCPLVMYCTEQCKNEAFDKYHQYECVIRGTLEALGFPRTTIQCLKLIFMIKWERKNLYPSVGEETMYRSDRIKEVLELSHDLDNLDKELLYQRFSTATFIYHLIKKHTNFFEDLQEEEQFKEIILTFLSVGRINQTKIGEMSPIFTTGNYEYKYFATGIFPAVSLFNHSCRPNVITVFYGNHVVVRAIRSIKKGEQCFVAYDVEYTTSNLEKRQNFLQSRYYFTCKCRACVEEWETFEDLPTRGPKIKQWHKDIREEMVTSPSVQLALDNMEPFREIVVKNQKFERSRNYSTVLNLFIMCCHLCGNFRMT